MAADDALLADLRRQGASNRELRAKRDELARLRVKAADVIVAEERRLDAIFADLRREAECWCEAPAVAEATGKYVGRHRSGWRGNPAGDPCPRALESRALERRRAYRRARYGEQ